MLIKNMTSEEILAELDLPEKTQPKGDPAKKVPYFTKRPPLKPSCEAMGQRVCEDGSCIPQVDLCEEEQVMNQNTILIMIVVGMAVIIFLIILYCFQQRQRRQGNSRHSHTENCESILEDEDNASLYQPPPTYDEVVLSNLYPPTPQSQRMLRISSSDEPPLTPPPNYDAALYILSQSHESVLMKSQRRSSLLRRTMSVDEVGGPNRLNSVSSNTCKSPSESEER